MPSTISAGTTAGTAIAVAGDTTGNLAFQTNGTTTAMTIDTSQNVGIGTTSPSFKVSITGGGSTAKINTLDTFDGGASLSTWMKVGRRAGTGNNAYINTSHNGSDAVDGLAFAFGTSGTGTEAMRIDSSANLQIGNPTFAVGSVATRVSPGNISFRYNLSSNIEWANFLNSNGQVGTISSSGTSTSYNTSSDYRLKENIAPMIGALAKVQQLKPCTYTWKADGSQGEGFIAHELQAVVPDAVTGEKDAVNEDGSIKPQGIDTSFLVATLTAAIQELNAKVEAQAAEIAALKGA